MKVIVFNFLMLMTTLCFSYSAHADEGNVFVVISQRCNQCAPLAKKAVVAFRNLSDRWKYGFILRYILVAQNTENVYRWHNGEALAKLSSMSNGLHYCSGDCLLQEAGFIVHRLDSCRKATRKEQYDYEEAFRSTTPGGHQLRGVSERPHRDACL